MPGLYLTLFPTEEKDYPTTTSNIFLTETKT